MRTSFSPIANKQSSQKEENPGEPNKEYEKLEVDGRGGGKRRGSFVAGRTGVVVVSKAKG